MSSPTSPAQRTASIVLVDDQPDLRFLAEKILSAHGFEVVGTAEDGQAGIELVARTQPDVVLLDLAMPRLSGDEALPSIVRDAPTTMVAILSAHLSSERAHELLSRGAFAAYDKGDLSQLPDLLGEDLRTFRGAMEGVETVPSWQRRYRRP